MCATNGWTSKVSDYQQRQKVTNLICKKKVELFFCEFFYCANQCTEIINELFSYFSSYESVQLYMLK